MRNIAILLSLVMVGLEVIASPVRSAIGGRETSAISNAQKPYDAEVEYIGSKAYQNSYIDSGVIIQESDGLLHHLVVDYTSNNPGHWGFFAFGFPNGQWIGIYNRDKKVCFGSANKGYSWNAATGWADYCYDSTSGWYVNGDKKISDSCVLGTDTRTTIKGKTFFIISSRDVRYASQQYSSPPFETRYKRFKVTLDGILVRDYIPVRITNEDGAKEGAMYDKVSGEIFRNSGSGSFIIGPDL